MWHKYRYKHVYGFITAKIFTLGADGYCRHSMRLPIRPSVRPKRRYRSKSLRISAIGLKFGGGDAQYHVADRYLKWPCSAIFLRVSRNLEIFHERYQDQVWLRDDFTTLTL